jgi:hypothetical protein
LDALYFSGSIENLHAALSSFDRTSYALVLKKSMYKTVIGDLAKGGVEVHPALFEAYSENLRTAISRVLNSPNAGDKYFDLQQKMELNVSRFAAAKSYQVTQLIQRLRYDENGAELPTAEFEQRARSALNTFNRYQAAEYNTTVARARSAKQWIDFNSNDLRNELFPNIKWLPSRSSVKREEHIKFYNKVWAKGDPFWNENQPGNLWNCKCDWIETDEPVSGEQYSVEPARGLGGNPARTGKVFSEDAAYFKATPRHIEDVQYTDSKSKLKISVCADANEIADNIRTGRILLVNHPSITLAIRKHLVGVKNPEYLLDEMKADAKRVNSWNVASAFSKSIKQEAEVVIIDLFKMYKPDARLSKRELAKNIARRFKDFESGTVKRCFVVWGEKSVEITQDMFAEKAHKDVAQDLEVLLQKLL